MSKAISWFTPASSDRDYGITAIQIIKALRRKGVVVNYNSPEEYTHISFTDPPKYSGNYNQYRIGYSTWESSEIPEEWLYPLSEQAEIWVPSQFCADVFARRGFDTKIIPFGIDSESWKIEQRYIRDEFTFVHIGGLKRQGVSRVIQAFREAFSGDENVRLIVQTIDFNIDYPRIFPIYHSLSEDELGRLFSEAHCMVYPTNGEGFGTVPFHSIATGLPTIVTEGTACDWLAALSVPLEGALVPAEAPYLGEWMEPSHSDLVNKMRYIYENYDEVKEKTINSAKIIHSTQTWDHVADNILEALEDRVKMLS